MALTDTPWCGTGDSKLYLQSGKFTSILLTSETVSGPVGITFDGTDTYWCASGNILYLQSGQFTSTVKDSLDVSSVDATTRDISYDGNDIPWTGDGGGKLYLQSGVFSSTLKTSEASPNTQPSGISFDSVDTPHCGFFPDTVYLMSGQFSSTIKANLSVSNDPNGISFDGTDSLWTTSGGSNDKLFLASGQFTSTILDSEDVNSIDASPSGICTNDFSARTGVFLGSVLLDELPATLTMPALTIDLISNIVITPTALALGIAAEATPHVNSNVARPDEIAMGINAADPVIEFGNEASIGAELAMSMNLFAPTINIITQTIVTPTTLNITAAFVEGVATPDYSWLDSSLPMLTLNAAILNGFTGTTSLPMLTLSANCVVGFLAYVTVPLPMLTLDIRMGVKVGLTMPMLTLEASGTTTNGGGLAKPLPLLTLNAAGRSTNKGVFTQSLPMFTIDIVMALGGIHTFASSLPMFTLSSEGVSGNPSAFLAENLPLVTLDASGYSDGNGTLAKSLPLLVLDAFGTSYLNRII
jgi:hypothetical protein